MSSSSAAYGLRRAKYVTIEELILSHYDIDQERLELELAELKQKHPTTTTIAVNTPSGEDLNLTEDTVVADVVEQEVECNTVFSSTNVHNTAAVKPNAWTVPNSNVRPIAASPSAADSTTTIKQPQLFPIPSTTTTSRPYHPSRLQPPRDGFNLCLLVHKVDIVVNKYRVDGSHVLVAEVTVGDESGSISVRARDEQIDLFRQVLVSSSTSNNSSNKKGGTAVVLRNCTMELYLGKYLRLGVRKRGKISIYPDGIPSTPSPPSRINQEVNYSYIDLNLVASPKKIVSAIVDHDGNDDNNGRPSYFPAMVQAPSQVVRHHHQQQHQQQQQQNQNNRHYYPPMKHHQQYQRQQNQRQLPEHTTNFGGKKSSTSGGRCQQQQQRQQKQQYFFPHHNIHQSRGFSSSSGNSSRQIYQQQQASSQQMLQHYQQQHQHQQLQRQYSDTSSVYSYHSGDGSQYQSQHHQQQQHHHQQQQQQYHQLIPNEHYNHQQYIYQQYQDMQYRHSQQMVLLQQEQETQLHFLNQQQQVDSNSSSVGGGVYSTVFRGGEEDIAAFLAPPQAEEEYTTLTHSSPLISSLSSHHHHYYHQNTNITASAYVTISPLPSMILEDSPQQQQRQLPLLYDDSTVAPAEAPN